MNKPRKKPVNKYNRVMPRVFNDSTTSVNSRLSVTKHTVDSPVGKQTHSNISSGVFNELPIVLNDYVPEYPAERPKMRSFVTKPKKTIKSLNPPVSPLKSTSMVENPRSTYIKMPHSAPSIRKSNIEQMVKAGQKVTIQPTNIKLKNIQVEIERFRKADKMEQLRKKMFDNFGVNLDASGHISKDKQVQAELREDAAQNTGRTAEQCSGAHGRAPVSDEQMRMAVPGYPVDRYLVERSKPINLNNILDGSLWESEPTLKPEDEIMLQKLHDMLQSTAEDLKELSGELSKFHHPGIQHKTPAMPLDEEFNEKVHIEEVVNAKFHGYKMVEPVYINKDEVHEKIPKKQMKNTATQSISLPKKNLNQKSFSIARLKSVQIADRNFKYKNTTQTVNHPKPEMIGYKEMAFKDKIQTETRTHPKPLHVQEMPSINIRAELKKQNVYNLNISPKETVCDLQNADKNNAVVDVNHETIASNNSQSIAHVTNTKYLQPSYNVKKPARKVTKLSTCESSDATNISSEPKKISVQIKQENNKISPPKLNIKNKNQRNATSISHLKRNDQMKQKKLHSIYGKNNVVKCNSRTKSYRNKTNVYTNASTHNALNNAQYVPYSQLTLGGVKLRELEREISHLAEKEDIPLSPILDQILNENSVKDDSSKKNPKIISTSDENLLDDVIDIKNKISQTISDNKVEGMLCSQTDGNVSDQTKEDSETGQSYDDDFEDVGFSQNSNESDGSDKNPDNSTPKERVANLAEVPITVANDNDSSTPIQVNATKRINLSIKNSVDIYEFIHSVDTQETATQSNCTQTISLKETQTSPTNSKIDPIHNDSVSSIDPAGEVSKMFRMEKELIKQLIIEEYGDLLQKTISKPSTSQYGNDMETNRNVLSIQKNTQTSPSHAKSVMTSPRSFKTRTTSPFRFNLTVDHHTSPMFVNRDEREIQTDLDKSEVEDLGISINLSSPRFSLKLPLTSNEVLSNLELYSHKRSGNYRKSANNHKNPASKVLASSTSMDADYSSSELSSLGEIKFKLQRSLRQSRVSESSASSSSTTGRGAGPSTEFPLAEGPTTNTVDDESTSIGQI